MKGKQCVQINSAITRQVRAVVCLCKCIVRRTHVYILYFQGFAQSLSALANVDLASTAGMPMADKSYNHSLQRPPKVSRTSSAVTCTANWMHVPIFLNPCMHTPHSHDLNACTPTHNHAATDPPVVSSMANHLASSPP